MKDILLIATVLCTPAMAQILTEDFDTANTHMWSKNNALATYNSTGGNPGGNISVTSFGPSAGATNLAADLLLPRMAGQPWKGDFRALGVSVFRYDREATMGFSAFGVQPVLILADDNGTAAFNDDAFIVIPTDDSFQITPEPWATKSALIDAQNPGLPAFYEVGITPGNPLFGTADDVVWNLIIQDVDYIAIALGTPVGGFPIGPYDMAFDNFVLDNSLPGTGVNFCDPSANNVTGVPTRMSASLTTGGAGVLLNAVDGPPGQFGYFLVGTSVSDPGSALSNGFLCLTLGGGQSLGRYNVSGTAFNSTGQFSPSGRFSNLVGTGSNGFGFVVPSTVPITGSPVIMTGETWNFQLWHRDSLTGMGESNFSNGVSVTF